MNNIFICKICNKEFNSIHALSLHLKKHNISAENYYRQYLLKQNEGFCKICGQPTTYHSLSKGFRQYCSNSCLSKDKDVVKKREETSLIRFGVKHASELKYFSEKAKQTYKEKTGYDHNMHNPESIIKVSNSHKNNKNNIIGHKIAGIKYTEHAIENFKKIIKPYNLTLINWVNKENITIYCNICKNEFNTRSEFIYKRVNKSLLPCPFCCPKPKQTSFIEKELVNYIKSIYNGIIIENDRNILNGKELDIYIPDKKLAFEFDGTYWHADPRFYNDNDIISGKNLTAKEIWHKDYEKNELTKLLNINLIHILEYDWKNNNILIKKIIYNLLQ